MLSYGTSLFTYIPVQTYPLDLSSLRSCRGVKIFNASIPPPLVVRRLYLALLPYGGRIRPFAVD